MKDKVSMTFLSYLETLHQSASIALGKAPNPIDGSSEFAPNDVETILQLVDLMREKTRGNLTSKESRTLEAVREDIIAGYNENVVSGCPAVHDENFTGERFEIH